MNGQFVKHFFVMVVKQAELILFVWMLMKHSLQISFLTQEI